MLQNIKQTKQLKYFKHVYFLLLLSNTSHIMFEKLLSVKMGQVHFHRLIVFFAQREHVYTALHTN